MTLGARRGPAGPGALPGVQVRFAVTLAHFYSFSSSVTPPRQASAALTTLGARRPARFADHEAVATPLPCPDGRLRLRVGLRGGRFRWPGAGAYGVQVRSGRLDSDCGATGSRARSLAIMMPGLRLQLYILDCQ